MAVALGSFYAVANKEIAFFQLAPVQRPISGRKKWPVTIAWRSEYI